MAGSLGVKPDGCVLAESQSDARDAVMDRHKQAVAQQRTHDAVAAPGLSKGRSGCARPGAIRRPQGRGAAHQRGLG
jgi:hypothetical protein